MTRVKVTIHGAQEAVRVARDLDRAGDGRFKRHLFDAVERANRGVEAELRTSAVRVLPKRGGLGRDVSRANITVRRMLSGTGVGITVTATHQYEIDGIDKGLVIHPLFGGKVPGHRNNWYRQSVRPGWFTKVMRGQEGPTRRELERAVSNFNV